MVQRTHKKGGHTIINCYGGKQPKQGNDESKQCSNHEGAVSGKHLSCFESQRVGMSSRARGKSTKDFIVSNLFTGLAVG